jgi:RES domain-containing protein
VSVPGTPGTTGIPEGITYDGTVFRAVNPKYTDSAWDITASNIASNHRYSGIGRGALYTSTSESAMLAEMQRYGIDMSMRAVVSQPVSVGNILDLTNPAVRSQLGISLEQITGNDYFYTQAIGDFSRTRYSGILAPSARQAGTSNLILFQELKP